MKNVLKVLIVDDDPNIVMSLEFLLKKNNYQVSIALSGNEALEIIKNTIPDIILLDVMMPGISGFEVCQFVKKEPLYQHAHVIFLSAKSKESDIKKGYELGARTYFVKPFSTRKLMQEIISITAEQQ